MIKLCKVNNDKTKAVLIASGSDIAWYKKQGFIEKDCEQDWTGAWYLAGYAPQKPVDIQIEELEKEIEKINAEQLRDMTIIFANESTEKMAEAKKYFDLKQEKKNNLINKINGLMG